MVLAKVVGSVVSTIKEPRLEGIKFILLEKIDAKTLKGKKDFVVAMDAVGAGDGEIVFFVGGSSSRQTEVTTGKPSDATIIAIVDSFDMGGKTLYSKGVSVSEPKKGESRGAGK
ncbi:MAG: EutN/CcmL family microcompartment protein [Spirochaetota bacterium]|nr:EutN/CcmL family microcompartment protein [Spirochaetota bacterium]